MFFGLMVHPLLRNMLAESRHHERLTTVEAAERLPRPRAGLLARLTVYLGGWRLASLSAVGIAKPKRNGRRPIGVGS